MCHRDQYKKVKDAYVYVYRILNLQTLYIGNLP